MNIEDFKKAKPLILELSSVRYELDFLLKSENDNFSWVEDILVRPEFRKSFSNLKEELIKILIEKKELLESEVTKI